MFDDLPSDLNRLETLRIWHDMWVRRIDEKIARLRVQEAQRAHATAAREERAPDWLIDYGLNRASLPIAVHVGGCRMAGKRAEGTDSETALRALAGGVPACTVCRPDTELGFLEG
ncbi:DUF6233 domain-containing protein [Streptomyces sp. NPDC001118]